MSIEAMKQAIDALNEAVAFREGGRQKAIDAITALRTAIQQAEAQQPATGEPVQADSSGHLCVIASLGAALRRLSFAAQTTGGTDGPDAELQSAIGQAEQALSLGGIWQAMSATPEPVAWFEYSEQHKSWFLAYTRNPHVLTRPLVFGDTHPAPGVPDNVACKSVQKRLKAQQPATTEPAGYLYDFKYDDEIVRDWFTQNIDEIQFRPATCLNIRPLYTHPAPGVPDDVARDTERLNELEALVQSKGTHGLSFDYCKHVEDGYVVEKGFRVMWRHHLGERKPTLREAIDAASPAQKGQP